MKIFSLASGSRGNCSFIKDGNTAILIDAGLYAEKIEAGLRKRDESLESVKAVIITHEHYDHMIGLTGLVKYNPQIKIYAHNEVCNAIGRDNPIVKSNLVPIISPLFYINELTVSAFLLPHDSCACLGYSVYAGEKKFSIATDLGMVTDTLIESIYDSDLIFIESNHSVKLLKECTSYPYALKKRISGGKGHISNKVCGEVIAAVCSRRKEKNLPVCDFVLCHLSQNTNNPEAAISEVGEHLKASGIECEFTLANQANGSQVFEI